MAEHHEQRRRGRPTQAEAVEKRQGIIEAATQLFLERGYRDVSVRNIAEAAQVSTRTVFNLFEDKGSLFAACLESVSPGPDVPLLVECSTMVETLEQFAVKMLDILSEPQGLGFARLVMSDGRDLPELAEAGFLNQERQFFLPLNHYLSGQLQRPLEAAELTRTFIAMAIAKWNRSVTFNLPIPDHRANARHAKVVAEIFTYGVQGRTA